MRKIISTLIFSSGLTFLFLNFKNKSNFSNNFYIPMLVSLTTKYLLGDWDKGYIWSLYDILYWISTIGVSLLTIYLYKK